MHRPSIFIIAIIAFLLSVAATAEDSREYSVRMSDNEIRLIDSLETKLRAHPSHSDSLRLLFHIFDVSGSTSIKDRALSRIYASAKSAGATDVMLEALIHGTNLHFRNDSILTLIEQEMDRMQPSRKLNEAQLFLRMRRCGQKLAEANDEEHFKNLSEIIKQYSTTPPTDPEGRVEMLYALCLNLGRASNGELLERYIDKLLANVDSLQLGTGVIRNLIYKRVAPYFTNIGNHRKAVEIDKAMLNIIDSLATNYRSKGRDFRNLETDRYYCYRRLLGNYKALSPLEIEHFNKEINKLAATNAAVRNDIADNGRATIYYALATKQWQKALDEIKRQVDNPANRDMRNYFLDAMVQAAGQVGDRNAQSYAAMELYRKMKDDLENRSADRYRELQVLYDIVELKEQNASLAMDRNIADNKRKNFFIVCGCIVSLVLLGLVLLLWYQTVKLKRIAERRRVAAKRFHRERDSLYNKLAKLEATESAAITSSSLKTDLLNVVSHEIKTPINAIAEYSRLIIDCIPDAQRHYLNRFAKIIEQNTRIVIRLVDDVLDINDIESGNAHIHREPSSIFGICNLAMLSVFENGQPQNPEVAMVFNPSGKPDEIIDTDSSRVAQILVNLLSNAAKFTEKGKIVLDFDVDNTRRVARIFVEDTGIGVPSKAAEKIFERFVKLDPHTAGCGLGLYISRMTAALIGAKVYVDTKHRHGARFVIEIELPNKNS